MAAYPTFLPSIIALNEACPQPTLLMMDGGLPFHCPSEVWGCLFGRRGIAPSTNRPLLFTPWKGSPLGLYSVCNGGRYKRTAARPAIAGADEETASNHQINSGIGWTGCSCRGIRPRRQSTAVPPRRVSGMSSGGQKVTVAPWVGPVDKSP